MRKFLFVMVVLCLVFLSGCTSVKDINDDPEKFFGESVTVSGTASGVIKLGQLSGFTLEQDGEKIIVSSEDLPKEDEKVTVSGVVMKGSWFDKNYYILAKKVY